MNNIADKKPNVFVAGFPRCGTTYTLNILKQHPDVCVPNAKELNYFNWKFFFLGFPNFLSPYRKKTFKQYLDLFKKRKIMIDGSILAAYDHKSAIRIYNSLGDIKIIFLIRDKESLKKSLYKLMLHNGDIPKISYEKFLKKYQNLLRYYTDFDTHISIFKKFFSNVKIFNIIDNNTKSELKKIIKYLGLIGNIYDFNIDKNSKSKIKPAKYMHRIKRKILIRFPFLANNTWKK